MSAWKRLGPQWLQENIGSDRLKFVSRCSEFLGLDIDVSSVRHLAMVADAFFDEKILKDIKIRRILFSYQPRSVLISALNAAGFKYSLDASEEDLINELLKVRWEDDEKCRGICRALNISQKFVPKSIQMPPQTEFFSRDAGWSDGRIVQPFKQLKKYQFELYFDAVEILKNPRSRLLLRMPTGTGKTRTAVEILSELIRHFRSKNGRAVRALWVTDRSELLEQAAQCFKETWSHLGGESLKLVRLWGGYQQDLFALSEASEVIFASMQKLRGVVQKPQEYPLNVDIVVYDEAHRIVAETYGPMIDDLLFQNAGILLGLTATAGRGDGSSDSLRDFFNESSISLRPPENSDLALMEWLKSEGFISRANYHSVEGVKLRLSDADLRGEDFAEHTLRSLGSDMERSARLVKLLKDLYADTSNRIMTFCTSVQESENITAMLHFLGIEAEHVDGTTGDVARRDAISRFKSGELRILNNYGVLAEGFDAPKVNVVVIARPTKSLVLYSQMIGRGLRGPQLGGTALCDIYQVEDNFINLPDEDGVSKIFDRFWNQ